MEEERENKSLSEKKEKLLPQKLENLTPEIIKTLQNEPNCNEYALDIHSRWLTRIDCLNLVPKLRCLDLSFNFLTRIEGLDHCPELRELKLYSNKIADARGIGCCRKLEILYLTYNLLTELPNDIGALKKLKSLRIDRNQIRKFGPHIGQLRELKFLDASGNCFLSTQGLESLLNLEELYLGHNEIEKVPRLGKCAGMKELDLAHNHLKDLTGLKGMRQMQTLRLHHNHLICTTSLPPLPSLLELDLSFNRLTSLEGLVEAVPHLDILNLTNNRLEDLSEVIQELENLSELRELNLVGNPCTTEESFYDWWFPVVRGVTTLNRLEENEVTAEHRYGDEDFVKALIAGGGQPGTGDRPSTAGLRVRPPSSKGGRPGSALASSRPNSALSRLSTAHLRSLEKTPLPVLKPPNPRDGVIQRLEPLENVEVKAADFRMRCHSLKHDLTRAVTSRARTPEISPRERRKVGPPIHSPPEPVGNSEGFIKGKTEELPPAPSERPSTSSRRRKGSRSLSKALEYSETFHPPAAPPINPQESLSELLETNPDDSLLIKDQNGRGNRKIKNSARSFENQADEAFNVDEVQSSFVTQNAPIRKTSAQKAGSWIDKLLEQQPKHNDSSSEDDSNLEGIPRPPILEDMSIQPVLLASPKYESQKTAEKQRPLTAEQKKGRGGFRKFKIPSKARTHIETKLETEETSVPLTTSLNTTEES